MVHSLAMTARPARPPVDPRVADVVRRWAASAERGVIFDFNGTLSDDEPILCDLFADLFAEHLGWALAPDEYHARLVGLSDREIVGIAVAEHGGGDPRLVEELLRLRRVRYQQMVSDRSPVTADAAALVERLAGMEVPMAVVTGAQRADVRFVLDRTAVGHHLARLVAEEDVARGKPDPEGFLLGARLLGLPPGRILVLEDSVPGVRGAAAAGMPCVAVSAAPSDALLEAAPALVHRLHPSMLDG